MENALMSELGINELLALDIIGLDFCVLCKYIEEREDIIGACKRWLISLYNLSEELWRHSCDVDSCDKCSYFQKVENTKNKRWLCNKKRKIVNIDDIGDDRFEPNERY